jgi:hypothetical protein
LVAADTLHNLTSDSTQTTTPALLSQAVMHAGVESLLEKEVRRVQIGFWRTKSLFKLVVYQVVVVGASSDAI